jgi:hypothetical protein
VPIVTALFLIVLLGGSSPSAEEGRGERRHWAFEPVRKLDPPPDPSGWSQGLVDRFVIAKLPERGLEPVGPADKRTLIRPATFDLIGLPPTPEETAAFLADDSPDAFALNLRGAFV